MKSLINKEIYKSLMKLYSKDFNFVFRTCVQIITFDNELQIKEVCLRIDSNEKDILEKLGETIQKQIKECEKYLSDARTQHQHDKWVNAINTHYFYLERIVDYLDKKSA